MKKRTYYFDQDFFLDKLDEQVKYDVQKGYEESGKVDLSTSGSYQLILLREEQAKLQKKVDELEHLSGNLRRKLNGSLLVNLICYLFLIVVLLLSVQKIMETILALRQLLV